jgi:hypothetical protein
VVFARVGKLRAGLEWLRFAHSAERRESLGYSPRMAAFVDQDEPSTIME